MKLPQNKRKLPKREETKYNHITHKKRRKYLCKLIIRNLKFLLYSNFNFCQSLPFMYDQEKWFPKVLNLLSYQIKWEKHYNWFSIQLSQNEVSKPITILQTALSKMDQIQLYTIWFWAVSLVKWYTWIRRSWGPRFFSSSGICKPQEQQHIYIVT